MQILQLTNIKDLNGASNQWVAFIEVSEGILEMKISALQASKLIKYMKAVLTDTSNPFFNKIIYSPISKI